MSKAWQIGIIILVTTVAYLNIFGNGFVIDDQYFIKEWELTRSWGSVGQLLAGANPESQPGVYRPIRSLLYLVYYQLWGTNPFFYHLHSLLVHLAATVLVFLIVDQLSFPRKRESREEKTGSPIRSGMTAFIAALLFGLHPIHTESITYIAASMEMTGVVFMLGAFWLFVRSPRRRNGLAMTLSVVLALLAFFTYEMTITLPILLVLYEWILRVPSVIPAQAGIQRRKDWIPVFTGMTQRVLPYFVGAAGFFAVRFALGVGLGRGEYLAYSFFHTQLAMTKMWVKYLSLLVWPVTLSHNHTVVLGFEAFMTPYSDQAAI
ncbi:MAG: glucosyltransferase domain-containing protein, partial [Patescibacteria group bacterium]